MAGQDWSITIVQSGGSTGFEPQNGKVGAAQQASNSDMISWNNRTGETHQPWAATPDYTPYTDAQITRGSAGCSYLSDPIDPWSSSSPAYVCAAPNSGSSIIFYVCKNHPDRESERGTIVVTAS